MRYEVYGIYSKAGFNYLAGVESSLQRALILARESINTNCCRAFAILVKARKYSYPYEIMSGSTKGSDAFKLTRATMLVMPNEKYGNPILHESDGKRYWQDSTLFG